MQINKSELDIQLVELLPERETLFFSRNWQANLANVQFAQEATAIAVINGGDVTAANVAEFAVYQSNEN
jgi:hypothetical protein